MQSRSFVSFSLLLVKGGYPVCAAISDGLTPCLVLYDAQNYVQDGVIEQVLWMNDHVTKTFEARDTVDESLPYPSRALWCMCRF